MTELRPGLAKAGGVCPFLIAATGDWRLAAPTHEHRCSAFVPLTSLLLEKQARLCLVAAHTSCATYKASVAARLERAGTTSPEARIGRWGLARTAPLIEDTGGLLGTLITKFADRRTWPAIPALLLVTTLIAVGISGVRGEGQTAALASPTTPQRTSVSTTAEPTAPPATTEPKPSAAASVAPSAAPSLAPVPAVTNRFYTVQAGDTLGSSATKFHTTVSAIESLNGITDPRRLHIGQRLKLP